MEDTNFETMDVNLQATLKRFVLQHKKPSDDTVSR